MSNTEDFDAETEALDGELDAPDAPPAKGKPPAARKSGGGMGKFLVLLILLGLGGAAGGEKLGLIKLPFDIPGLSPVADPAAATASEMPPVPMPGGELAAATGSDAVPPGLAGDKMPSAMPDSLGAPPAEAAAALATGQPSIQPPTAPSISPPTISAPGSDPLAGFDAEEPAPALAADPLAAAPAPAADPLAATAPPVDADIDAGTDPLAAAPDLAAPAPDADPLATPGGPDMLATPVAPVETAPVAATPDTESLATISQLEEKVATLEKDLAAAQQKATDSEAALAAAEARARAAEATAAKKVKQQVGSAPAAGAEPTARPRAAKRQPRTASPAPIVATAHWVLKSAKPGVAWVALPGSNELKTISVGDTVTGLGKITAIAKDDSGRWVVNGTRGRINQ